MRHEEATVFLVFFYGRYIEDVDRKVSLRVEITSIELDQLAGDGE